VIPTAAGFIMFVVTPTFAFFLLPTVQAFFLNELLFGPTPKPPPCFPGKCVNCLTCWLAGGVQAAPGVCNGLFEVCCESPTPTAEARKLTFSPVEVTDNVQSLQDIQFGNVVNDPVCGRSQIARWLHL